MRAIYVGMLFFVLFAECAKMKCPDPEPAVPTKSISITPPPDTTTSVQRITIQSDSLIEDAYVSSATNGQNMNYGNDLVKFYTSSWTYSGAQVQITGFIKFNYSTLPAGKTVKKAILTLYGDTITYWVGTPSPYYGHYVDGTTGLTVKRVSNSWAELTVNYLNQPASSDINMVSCSPPTSNYQNYEIDVTNIVNDQLASQNNGFEVALSQFTSYNRIVFFSSEYSKTSLIPKLSIEY